jgi:hypothetical protein
MPINKHVRPNHGYHRNHRARKAITLLAKVVMIFALGFLNSGASMPQPDIDKIADAIYTVEGGDGTKYPYGIKSVPFRNKEEARQICERTIANTYRDWAEQNKEKYYLYFLADKYCPPSDDPKGNKAWRNNIVQILGQRFADQYSKDAKH